MLLYQYLLHYGLLLHIMSQYLCLFSLILQGLHEEGLNLGKTSCPLSPLTIRLDAQFGTPYPRSAGFDTDTGDFIESFAV